MNDAVASEFLDLAAMLEHVAPASWDTPSLCTGWRTREVVAHLTMPTRTSKPGFLFELVRARGNFNRMADRVARRDAAAMSPDALVGALRDPALHAWTPPGGGERGALAHVVIHGLDIAVPLDLDHRVPVLHLGAVLEAVTEPKSIKFFAAPLDGIELRADDLEWSFGSGETVTGHAQDLALVLCGRRLPAGRLDGDAAARLSLA